MSSLQKNHFFFFGDFLLLIPKGKSLKICLPLGQGAKQIFKINTFWIGLIFFVFPGFLSAQNNNLFSEHMLETKTAFTVNADYSAVSDAITNQLALAYWNGKFINDDIKNNVINKLHDHNLLGASYNANLRFEFYQDTIKNNTKTGFVFGIDRNAVFDAGFNRGLFKLLANGNKQYEGKLVNLKGNGLDLYTYQQIKGGVIRKTMDPNGSVTLIGAGLAMNLGQSYTDVYFSKALLYTQQDAEYIDFSADYNFHRSDTAHKSLGSINGLGASIDIFYKYIDPKGSSFQVEFTNLGFIRWNKNTQNLERDTSFHFTGINVQDIFNFNSAVFQNTLDTVTNTFAANKKKKGYTSNLPSLVRINYSRLFFQKKLMLTAGIDFLIYSFSKPLFYFRPGYFIKPDISVSAKLSYGGYSRFSYGLEFSGAVCKNLFLNIGTNNLNGYLSTKSCLSQGLFVSLRKTFK